MFELSKRKRLQILEQLSDQRDRLPSAERRKKVQEEYEGYLNTMNNVKPSNNSSLKYSSNMSKNSPQRQTGSKEEIPLTYSPTLADIPRPPTDRIDR